MVTVSRFFKRIINIIKEGLKGIWVHRSMGLASIISTFATLFVIGIIIIISVTVNNIAKEIEGKVDEVEIFIENGTTNVDKLAIETKINEFNGELTYKYRSSEEALNMMKETWGEDAALLDGITSDGLLPASFVISLKDINQADDFVSYIKEQKGVDDVKYYKDLIDQANKISYYVQIIGAIIVLVLMVVSLFIISNTIKLTVFSRREEIFVMRYVGANNNYIRIPFMIEGLFFGVVGSLLAFLAVYYGYNFVYNYFNAQISDSLSIVSMIQPILFRNALLNIFTALGAGIGVLGSIFSIRKYLRV